MLDILIFSDYVCPYCLVAKKALSIALEKTGLEANITYAPFELTEEPKPRVDTYHDETRREHYKILTEPCKKMGLDMKIPPNVVPRPYTRLAFEGWYYAKDNDKADEYNDAVYNAYFIDELDIGEISTLAQIAQNVGLDPDGFTKALTDGTYTKTVKDAVAQAKIEKQIHSVPTIYINGEPITLHTYTPEEMENILTTHTTGDGNGFSCGEDGCGFNI
jgi:predicted DsbA family dithiol-disulfide isomerase